MQVSISTNGSIIEDSPFLARSAWPDTKPDRRGKRQRIGADIRQYLAAECAVSRHFPSQNWWRKEKGSGRSTAEIVRNFLNHRVLQFNSKQLFGDSDHALHQIKRAISKHNCVHVILPVFCVISSWPKRHDTTSLTFAEEVSLRHLAEVASRLRENIGVGLRFTIISDATFYADIFGDCMRAALRYVQDLQRFVDSAGLGDALDVVDMSDIIETQGPAYIDALERNMQVFQADPAQGISAEEAIRWRASVASTLNVSDIPMSYGQLRRLHMSGAFPSDAIAAKISDRIDRAFVHYRAMKQSLADLNWDRAAYPHALRGTIHHKTAPVLGIRIYPEYKSKCQLLPYHGIAVVERGRSGWQMRVEQEIYQHDRPGLVCVEHDRGVSDFYVLQTDLDTVGAL